jgi:acyl carrier protein
VEEMESLRGNSRFVKETILGDLLKILEEMTSDWEMEFAGAIGPETHLVADLSFESIDVVNLAITIEEHFQRRNLPFQKLVMTPDGRYVDDLCVSELVDFLCTHINCL